MNNVESDSLNLNDSVLNKADNSSTPDAYVPSSTEPTPTISSTTEMTTPITTKLIPEILSSTIITVKTPSDINFKSTHTLIPTTMSMSETINGITTEFEALGSVTNKITTTPKVTTTTTTQQTTHPTPPPDTEVTTDKSPEFIIDDQFSNVVFIISLVSSVIGSLVNAVFLIVIFSQKKVREHALTPLMFYLTISNLLLSLIGLPMQTSRFRYKEWPDWGLGAKWRDINCYIYTLVNWPLITISLLTMVMIGMFRAVNILTENIQRHNQKNYFSWRRITFANVIILLTCEATILAFFYLGKIRVHPETKSCTICYGNHEYNYLNWIVSVVYLVSWLLMIILNVISFVELKRKFGHSQQSTTPTYRLSLTNRLSLQRRISTNTKVNRVSRAIITSVIAFTLLYVPCKYKNISIYKISKEIHHHFMYFLYSGIISMLLNPLEHQDEGNPRYAMINVICYMISWISVFANPIIYICTSSMYKEAFLNLFRCSSSNYGVTQSERSTQNSHLIEMNTMGRDVRKLPKDAF